MYLVIDGSVSESFDSYEDAKAYLIYLTRRGIHTASIHMMGIAF